MVASAQRLSSNAERPKWRVWGGIVPLVVAGDARIEGVKAPPGEGPADVYGEIFYAGDTRTQREK